MSDDVNTVTYLLDTSAIMALMEDELGADRVEKVLRQRFDIEHSALQMNAANAAPITCSAS